jgi:hypothetical protein
MIQIQLLPARDVRLGLVVVLALVLAAAFLAVVRVRAGLALAAVVDLVIRVVFFGLAAVVVPAFLVATRLRVGLAFRALAGLGSASVGEGVVLAATRGRTDRAC